MRGFISFVLNEARRKKQSNLVVKLLSKKWIWELKDHNFDFNAILSLKTSTLSVINLNEFHI